MRADFHDSSYAVLYLRISPTGLLQCIIQLLLGETKPGAADCYSVLPSLCSYMSVGAWCRCSNSNAPELVPVFVHTLSCWFLMLLRYCAGGCFHGVI